MKHILSLSALLLGLFLLAAPAGAQTLNWGAWTPAQKNLIRLHAGFEYGLVFGADYGHRLPTGIPLFLNATYSFPAGKNLTDDFNARIGGQAGLLRAGDFRLSAGLRGVFRREENAFVRMYNFGAELSGVAGYYRPHWFVAAEVGFDKALTTHFRHTPLMQENFPGVRDGWYGPTSGGHFAYGIQSGYSFKRIDLTLRIGRLLEQDLKTAPLTPFYAELGVGGRF